MKKLVLLFAILLVALPVFAGDGAFNFFGNKVIDFAVVSRKSGTISDKYQNIIGFISNGTISDKYQNIIGFISNGTIRDKYQNLIGFIR